MGDCVQCHEPLMLKVEETPDEPGVPTASYANGHSHYVPDDVELACGCHFHWQCLIDNNQDKHCPKCGWDVTIPTAAGIQMLVNIDNEGGSKESENIYPLIVEENWCREHPQERICRAFLELCREGEMSAVAGLLSDCERRENTRRTRAAVRARDELPDAPEPEDEDDEDDEDDNVPGPTAAQIMRYQDPLGNMESGLHAAIANKNDEVAWLLLYLGTKLNYHEFPAVIFQETQNLGIQRQDQVELVDIRALRDLEGRVPLQIAQEMGTYWRTWISSRRLVPAADPQGGYEGGGPA